MAPNTTHLFVCIHIIVWNKASFQMRTAAADCINTHSFKHFTKILTLTTGRSNVLHTHLCTRIHHITTSYKTNRF